MFALTIMAGFFSRMTSNVLFTIQQVQAQGATPKSAGSVTIGYPPLNVPRGGMVFQAADGKILAMLYADEEGAHFELRNNQSVAVVKLSGKGTVETYVIAFQTVRARYRKRRGGNRTREFFSLHDGTVINLDAIAYFHRDPRPQLPRGHELK